MELDYKTQREEILKMLQENPFVATTAISSIATQYNARIYELRKNGFCIEAATQEGICGFVLKKQTKSAKHCFECDCFKENYCSKFGIKVTSAQRCGEE
jgi:hypothetical protein